ncbi:MAG: hypothetical protein QM796_21145 [Chthoniobacteraceae bacterium]
MVRRDPMARRRQRRFLHRDQLRCRAKIGERPAFGMELPGTIQRRLQLVQRPARHQDIERAPTQHAISPEIRQQVLADHQVHCLRRQLRA